MTKVLYVPELKKNLFSIEHIVGKGCITLSNKGHGYDVLSGDKRKKLYELHMQIKEPSSQVNVVTSSKKKLIFQSS